ncbi:imidazolonepropionase [Kordiimonas sediminis]|uniref:Imidazolonepropionase n=1 Tax=Kordiimonas sediminis TaxID=1735581 RepID=A0A919AY70_9PROT|nr:imidazolonepropionase [Kordiimonas sediminis]GHF30879.1 imidazolonepropionase [Kordiimonas sediminis]
MKTKKPTFDTLYINVRIASMRAGGPDYGLIEDGVMGVTDGRLSFVGSRADYIETHGNAPMDAHAEGTVHDCGGKLALPGFIDCHTHLIFGGNRAREFEMRLSGKSYEEIARAGGGIMSTVTATREATQEDLVKTALPRLKAMTSMGVTTVEIKSGYGLTLDDELKMLRAAIQLESMTGITVLTTLLAAHAIPPEFKDNADGYIDYICAEILPAALKDDLIDAVDAFCENIAFSPEQVRRLFAFSKAEGLDLKLHAEQLSDQGGTELAAEFGALSADHLEYLSERGVEAMAGAGMTAVLLPGAFYTLKETKLPPISALRAAKVPMALATDFNPGSSPVQNIQLIANMGCLLFGLTPEEAIQGITLHAAKALGIDAAKGSLEVGKDADFCLFDAAHPAELIYWTGGIPPTDVIIQGKTLAL